MTGIDSETDVLTLDQAASAYFEANSRKIGQRDRVAVTRFISWCGASRQISEITAHEMTRFQEAQGENVANLPERLRPVKDFLAHAKRRNWVATNLGVHLRVKKRQRELAKGAAATATVDEAPLDALMMTAEGMEAAKIELARLEGERPGIQKDLAAAMADKDFRENAPLDAARDAQALLESRIRSLESQITQSLTADRPESTQIGMAHLGSRVTVLNLGSNKTGSFTLVGQGEVDASAGRISVASPVGQALVGRTAGDEVSVTAPSGTFRFRIEAVEG